MSQLFCGTCGTKFSDGDKFCKKCGAKKKVSETPVTKPEPQPKPANKTASQPKKHPQNISDVIGNKNPDDLMNRSQQKIVLTPFKIKNDVRRIGFLGLLLPMGIFIILAMIEIAVPTPITEVGLVITMVVAIVNIVRFIIGSFRFYKVYEVNEDNFHVYAAFNKKGELYATYRAAEYTPSPLLKIYPQEELEQILNNNKEKKEG